MELRTHHDEQPHSGPQVLPPCSGLPCGINGQLSGGVGVRLCLSPDEQLARTDHATQPHLELGTGDGALVQATSEYTPVDPFDIDKGYGVQATSRIGHPLVLAALQNELR
jgi:hypothetical protein